MLNSQKQDISRGFEQFGSFSFGFGWFGFFKPYYYLGWIYNLDVTQEAKIWPAGLTHKNMLTQGVFGGCVSLVWLVWFGFFQAYSYLGQKYNLDITKETEIWHAGSTQQNKTIRWGSTNLSFYLYLVKLSKLQILKLTTNENTFKYN